MAISDLETTRAPWQTCTTCHIIEKLDPDKRARLEALLANPAVRYTELSRELAADPEWRIDVDSQALGRHARGGCKARVKLR